MSAAAPTPPDAAPAPPAAEVAEVIDERNKLRFELYKMRVEEYRGRYESMRELEWKILFQMYAGYAAIAVVYEHLRKAGTPAVNQTSLSWLTIMATVTFYASARYLTYRIQERLIVYDSTRLTYLEAMHESLDAMILRSGPLGSRYYWTYHTQIVLSTTVCLAMVGYAAGEGLSASLPTYAIVIMALLALSPFCGWHTSVAAPE